MERSGNFYKANTKTSGKIRKKEEPTERKRHHRKREKGKNHQQGSMTVSDPTVLVQSGGNSLSSPFVRLCVAACFIHGAS